MKAKINIHFTPKSIEKAIIRMQEVENKMAKEIPETFLRKCCEYIIEYSNHYLEMSRIGAAVIQSIEANWYVSIEGNTAILKNLEEKSVYVEFGIGKVGGEKAYPQTYSPSSYEYNVPSRYKHKDEKWYFNVDSDDQLNIKLGNVKKKSNLKGKTYFETSGQGAVLYVYKAIMRFSEKVIYKELWQKTLKETLKKE